MGITIKTLTINNITPYDNTIIDWSKYKKVLITGINKMPGMSRNAVGKSMLADMLTWTLWGKSPREISRDTIRLDSEKSSWTEVEFDRDGVKYIVKRAISPSGSIKIVFNRYIDNEKDNSFKTGKTTKITQEMINKVIGIDYTTFISVSYFGQDNINIFLNGTPKEREGVITSFFSLDRWSDYKKIAKLALDKFIAQRTNLSNKLSFYKDLIKGINPEEISKKKKEAEIRKVEIRKELQVLNSMYVLARKYDKINIELDENRFRLDSAESTYRQIVKNLSRDVEELKKSMVIDSTLANKITYKKKLESDYSIINKQMEELIDKREPINKKIHYYESSRRSCINNIKEWEEIISMGEDRRCPTCNQLLSDKYIGFIKEKIEKNRGHAEDWKTRAKKAASILAGIDIKINVLATKKQNIQTKINEIHVLEGRLYAMKEKKEQIKTKESILKKEEISYNKKIKTYNNLIAKQEDEINNIIKQLGDRIISADKVKELTDNKTQQLVEAENEFTEMRRMLSEYRSYKRNMNGIEKQQIILEKRIVLYEYIIQAYTDIKLYMIDVINQSLQDQINTLLTKMNVQAKVLLDIEYDKKSGDGKISKYGIKINTSSDKEREWKSFSGGEKKRISLAVYFAFQKIAEKFSKENVNILIFDEVFGGLDVAGRNMMMELIDEYSRYKNIYVITHLEDMMSMFSNKIVIVRGKNGISELSYD